MKTPKPAAAKAGAPQRLQKVIATAGVTSRRKAEELILEGLVKVNGVVVTELGVKIDPAKDRVTVDGRGIHSDTNKVYILLNKPKGYISAVSDPQKRPVVVDLVRNVKERVYPVGRLDFDAEGALILTNDGELSHMLIHPAFHVPKKYLVKVKDVPSPEDLEKLAKGVWLEDGRTFPAKAKFIRQTKENSWIELTVFEGRNRLVKRMCMAIGHPVSKLKRIEFAGIKLDIETPGAYRMLTPDEIRGLKNLQSTS
ncbi:MAG: rRNA pseudouridine synthase [Deltaproteobacteria bacterium]|nr:rRNA pseudouridine synthase [Deltaproteobacteria bacterium]